MVEADLAYLRALLGERPPLADYVRATQGCETPGWSDEEIATVHERAVEVLSAIGVEWGSTTDKDLKSAEGVIDAQDAPDAIRDAAKEYEATVRQLVRTDAPFELSVEEVDIDAYWAYWLDGAGHRVRLRLNFQGMKFTQVAARQFALHEVLGHGLQGASWSARAATENVPWIRLMSVHARQQILLEGLAQALPLFVAPDDDLLVARVRLDHYTQLSNDQNLWIDPRWGDVQGRTFPRMIWSRRV